MHKREDAEELTQDVFVKIHSSMSSFDERSSWDTWIYRIAINCCLDHIKSKKRKKRFAFLSSLFSDDGSLDYDKPVFEHPGVQLEHKEALERLFGFIDLLPERQRTVLILTKIEHKSYEEIALSMDISPKAAESLFQRAKRNLAEKLGAGEGSQ